MVVLWVLIVLAVVAVVVIGLVVVGGQTAKLASYPRQSMFDIVEAVPWIADRLPFEVAAEVSHEDVRWVCEYYLRYYDEKDVPIQEEDGADLGAQTVVTHEDEAVDSVLRRAEVDEVDIDPLHVVVIIDLVQGYLGAIGAVGPEATEGLPELPSDRAPELPSGYDLPPSLGTALPRANPGTDPTAD